MSNPYFCPDYTLLLHWIIGLLAALLVVVAAFDGISLAILLRRSRIIRGERLTDSDPLRIAGGMATKSDPPPLGEFEPVPTPAPPKARSHRKKKRK